MNFTCCNKDPIWVENVPGKGYYFCQECRSEVLEPKDVFDPADDAWKKIDWNEIVDLLKGIP